MQLLVFCSDHVVYHDMGAMSGMKGQRPNVFAPHCHRTDDSKYLCVYVIQISFTRYTTVLVFAVYFKRILLTQGPPADVV